MNDVSLNLIIRGTIQGPSVGSGSAAFSLPTPQSRHVRPTGRLCLEDHVPPTGFWLQAGSRATTVTASNHLECQQAHQQGDGQVVPGEGDVLGEGVSGQPPDQGQHASASSEPSSQGQAAASAEIADWGGGNIREYKTRVRKMLGILKTGNWMIFCFISLFPNYLLTNILSICW